MTKVERVSGHAPHQHVDSDARHLDAPLLQVSLPEEIAALRGATATGSAGHTAKTLSKHPDLRVVLINFEAGGRMDRHEAPGRISVHVIDGRIEVRVEGQSVVLRAGELLEIAPGIPHEVVASEQSAMLLTVAWPSRA